MPGIKQFNRATTGESSQGSRFETARAFKCSIDNRCNCVSGNALAKINYEGCSLGGKRGGSS